MAPRTESKNAEFLITQVFTGQGPKTEKEKGLKAPEMVFEIPRELSEFEAAGGLFLGP